MSKQLVIYFVDKTQYIIFLECSEDKQVFDYLTDKHGKNWHSCSIVNAAYIPVVQLP